MILSPHWGPELSLSRLCDSTVKLRTKVPLPKVILTDRQVEGNNKLYFEKSRSTISNAARFQKLSIASYGVPPFGSRPARSLMC